MIKNIKHLTLPIILSLTGCNKITELNSALDNLEKANKNVEMLTKEKENLEKQISELKKHSLIKNQTFEMASKRSSDVNQHEQRLNRMLKISNPDNL